jgi:MFS family permease
MQKVAVGWKSTNAQARPYSVSPASFNTFRWCFTLIAGHVTDSYNRKRVLMAALGATALAALILTLNSAASGSVVVLYCCLFALGTARLYHAGQKRLPSPNRSTGYFQQCRIVELEHV